MELEKIISSEILNRVMTAEDLLQIHNISLDEWEITKKVVNSWDSSYKDKEGKMIHSPNFQVKIWLQNKKAVYDLNKVRKEFVEDIALLSPKVKKLETPAGIQQGKLLEANIFDLHLGKVAWGEETGSNYDLNTACELFMKAVRFFVDRAKSFKVERILFPIGNDFFNSDYAHPYSRTTKGTPQEEDTRWQKTFRTGRNLIVQAVTELATVAPVDVVIIPGNHDVERSFYLGDSLEAWFHNNENVHIDNSASPRKYYNYGKVLLGLTHGSEEPINNLPGIMAQEQPELWGKTLYREFHLGHLHHRKSKAFLPTTEVQGTVVRYMSSLSGTDAWHHRKGYVGARRSAEALVWDKELGLEANIFFNVGKTDES
jgi:hypothetical protein